MNCCRFRDVSGLLLPVLRREDSSRPLVGTLLCRIRPSTGVSRLGNIFCCKSKQGMVDKEAGKNDDIASKLVQEIAKKGDQVPESYLVKDEDLIAPAIDIPSLWEDTLLVDYSLLSSDSSTSPAHQKELAKVHSALRNWGCFQVINHGMPSLFLDELLEVSKQFFALPLEERLKCKGYGHSVVLDGDKSLNWNDKIFLAVYPLADRKVEVWPEKPHRFREILDDYSMRLNMMFEYLLKAMAQSVDLKEDGFLKQHGEASITARVGIYPRCSRSDQVYGVHPHADGSTFTILLQDKDVREGLQIQKDDQWFKVPVIPGALFVNVGDFGEVISNGVFKSLVHRVVTNSVRDRVSIAAFCAPQAEIEVEPVNELVSADQPKKYKKLSRKTYRQLYFETSPQRKRVLDLLKM